MKKISPKKQQRIVRDILSAKHDLVGLAEEHHMTPELLASWANRPTVRKRLHALCSLADVQTQVLLSRYRLLAASKLIRLATEDAATGGGDTARRACVDLLRLELHHVKLNDAGGEWAGELPSEQQLIASLQGADFPHLLQGANACRPQLEQAELPGELPGAGELTGRLPGGDSSDDTD